MTNVKFFAGARAAIQVDSMDVPGGWALGEFRQHVLAHAPAAIVGNPLARQHVDGVIARCTLLVNGRATTDSTVFVADADRIDVLPPFAGG